MALLRVTLFGRMEVEIDGKAVSKGLDSRKVQELLGYLLLYRQRPHPREALAEVLWGENAGAQARKYLRQALWQLQSALKGNGGPDRGNILRIEPEWVAINSDADFWVDVGEFESAYDSVQGASGQDLAPETAHSLARAADLHQSGLLQGWYQDWCIFERERLENMYLVMLNKLMTYFESRQQYEIGLAYGHRILQLDRAHERTHWRMMRLHYLAGDRTAALRQYERCVSALQEELGVKPARWTTALYEQIRADQIAELSLPQPSRYPTMDNPTAADIPAHLSMLQALLYEWRHELQRYIQSSGMTPRD